MEKDIGQWQKDFRAAPSVWIVFDPDDCMSNVYASREAAMLEVARHRRYSIREVHIHSLDLAQRRWGMPQAPTAPTEGG